MSVTITDHTPELLADIRRRYMNGLEYAAEAALSFVTTAISNGPPPSHPGEPPHVDSGNAMENVGMQQIGSASDPSGLPGYRVGYPHEAYYMGMHESGITYPKSGFQKRPSLEPTIKGHAEELGQIFIAGSEVE